MTKKEALSIVRKSKQLIKLRNELHEKYHNFDKKFVLCGFVEIKHGIHVYQGIEELAELLESQLKTTYDRDEPTKPYEQSFEYDGVRFFQLF